MFANDAWVIRRIDGEIIVRRRAAVDTEIIVFCQCTCFDLSLALALVSPPLFYLKGECQILSARLGKQVVLKLQLQRSLRGQQQK